MFQLALGQIPSQNQNMPLKEGKAVLNGMKVNLECQVQQGLFDGDVDEKQFEDSN